mgnify:FL=1
MKIVDLDAHAVNPGDLSWEQFENFGELIIYERTPQEEVVNRAKDADAILINKIKITSEILEQLPKLRYIGELATGYNNIDLVAASQRNIVVSNIPAYSTMSVAQHAFALLLNVTNSVSHYAKESRSGVWSHCPDFCYWNTPLLELAGKTIGIVGFGNIGRQVAQIAHAFGMEVIAATSKTIGSLPDYVKKTTIEGLFASSDVISLHCPLTNDNFHFINEKAISFMRKGVILINTARGALIDTNAVAKALSSGHIGAYCADVMEEEPPVEQTSILSAPNAFITPHIAWASRAARLRLMDIAVDNLKAFLEGKPKNQVNA